MNLYPLFPKSSDVEIAYKLLGSHIGGNLRVSLLRIGADKVTVFEWE
jgi:hypothetical protein